MSGATSNSNNLSEIQAAANASLAMEDVANPARLQVVAALSLFLKLCILAVFLLWLGLWLFRPTHEWASFTTSISTICAASQANLILFSAPIFLIVLLAAAYLQTKPTQQLVPRKGTVWWCRYWSCYPVIIHGLFGVVTAADLLCIALFMAVLIYNILGFGLSTDSYQHADARWQQKMESAGHKSGQASLIAIALLFFPVARGSVLLRLANISFDRAIKYHKWVASIMMATLLVHGGSYLLLWQSQRSSWQQLWRWKKEGTNNLAGLIAEISGILICVTSLPQVRLRMFELFFFTHQLYTVFIVLGAIHVGEKTFLIFMAGVFLFSLDRFMRFLQSRKSVQLLASRHLPGDMVELVFAKDPAVDHVPASFIFLNVPDLSPWQWHPFSVSSTSLDRISILVKCQGDWTRGLQQMIHHSSSSMPFRASLEGPYGQERSAFFSYTCLVLVAGGSGIAPFLSVVTELAHMSSSAQVTLIWAVRKSSELALLDCLLPPHVACRLNLQVQAYVTREERATPELHAPPACIHQMPQGQTLALEPRHSEVAVVMASVTGYLCIRALISHTLAPASAWTDALFSLLSMLLGIIAFGGSAHLLVRRWWKRPCRPQQKPALAAGDGGKLVTARNLRYGSRPDFKELWEPTQIHPPGTHVGVFASGPESLQAAIAQRCAQRNSPFLHYHSLSFQL